MENSNTCSVGFKEPNVASLLALKFSPTTIGLSIFAPCSFAPKGQLNLAGRMFETGNKRVVTTPALPCQISGGTKSAPLKSKKRRIFHSLRLPKAHGNP